VDTFTVFSCRPADTTATAGAGPGKRGRPPDGRVFPYYTVTHVLAPCRPWQRPPRPAGWAVRRWWTPGRNGQRRALGGPGSQARPLPAAASHATGLDRNELGALLVAAGLGPPAEHALISLRDVQEAASHADPRTTMRYDRAHGSLDRHATYVVAAYVAGAAR
jgi:hypothetical protein